MFWCVVCNFQNRHRRGVSVDDSGTAENEVTGNEHVSFCVTAWKANEISTKIVAPCNEGLWPDRVATRPATGAAVQYTTMTKPSHTPADRSVKIPLRQN